MANTNCVTSIIINSIYTTNKPTSYLKCNPVFIMSSTFSDYPFPLTYFQSQIPISLKTSVVITPNLFPSDKI
jgi:hypothetical protein